MGRGLGIRRNKERVKEKGEEVGKRKEENVGELRSLEERVRTMKVGKKEKRMMWE